MTPVEKLSEFLSTCNKEPVPNDPGSFVWEVDGNPVAYYSGLFVRVLLLASLESLLGVDLGVITGDDARYLLENG